MLDRANTAQDGIAAAARGITQDLRTAKAVRS